MKRIILSENSLQGLQDAMKKRLPDYVYQSVKKHDTSLGDSPCYPPSDDYAFDYKLLKIRYSDILDNIEKRNLPLDKDKAETLLYKLTNKAMKLERPIRPQLVKLVENHVNKLFSVPSETINLTCSLTDTVKPDHALRIVPEEDSDNNDYVFNDVDEINAVSNAVKKRRFIDALIQGYSTITANKEDMYSDFLGDHGFTELVDLYGKITALNDYLVFINKEHLDKKNPHLVAYVGVHLGHGDNRTEIRSQGILYPYLLKETIRGFMELFSSHGLPEDNGKAQILISKSDFAIAEPWDNRLGVPLWQIMFGKQSHALPDNVIPYFFSEFVSLPNDDFFSICQNLLMRTKKAQKYIKDMVANVKHDKDYQEFVKNIQQKNIDQSVITDGYMTADDLDNVVISEDGNLEENQEDEYIDSPELSNLKYYLTMDDESKKNDYLYKYAASIYDFIKDKNWEDEFSDEELEELKDNDENDFENNIDILKNHPDVASAFLKYAENLSEYWGDNANDVFDYEDNVDVNKDWLIHFSEDAGSIAYKGFIKGTGDLEHLALTDGSNYSSEGYNFAFLADEVTNSEAEYYCGRNSDNWGAVMFHANGIEAYHYGDNQNQVIFWGPSARDLVPIYHGNVDIDIDHHYDDYADNRGDNDDTWYVTDDKSPYGRILYSNQEIEYVIAWVENNFFQYRKRLNYHTYAKSDYEERARKRPQKS